MELFVKIVNRIKMSTIFLKKLHPRCLSVFLIYLHNLLTLDAQQQTASYEITLVCLSVCPVHVSLPKWTKIGPKTRVFLPFFKFGSLVFLEIAYTKISCNNVSHLFQPEMAGFGSKISYKIIHITSSTGEIHEKNFWTKFGLKRAKIT